MVIGDDQRDIGRRLNHDKENRLNGMQLRDKLHISLMNHDMHRARREDWGVDANNYVIRS